MDSVTSLRNEKESRANSDTISLKPHAYGRLCCTLLSAGYMSPIDSASMMQLLSGLEQ